MIDLFLVWWMKLNKLSLSTRAKKQRDREMTSSWRPWELGITSELEGQTFFLKCNMIIMKKIMILKILITKTCTEHGVAAQKEQLGAQWWRKLVSSGTVGFGWSFLIFFLIAEDSSTRKTDPGQDLFQHGVSKLCCINSLLITVLMLWRGRI